MSLACPCMQQRTLRRTVEACVEGLRAGTSVISISGRLRRPMRSASIRKPRRALSVDNNETEYTAYVVSYVIHQQEAETHIESRYSRTVQTRTTWASGRPS